MRTEAPEGVEPTVADLQSDSNPRISRGKRIFDSSCQQIASSNRPEVTTIADVLATVERCPDLPEAIKAGMLAMVRAAMR